MTAFIWPVIQDENTVFSTASLPYDNAQKMRLGQDLVLAFKIDSADKDGHVLDRSMVTIVG